MPQLPMKLYMIPGSGTDKRMYAPQLEEFTAMTVTEWVAPLGLREPLESYARRLAKQIDTSSPFALGGVSLGGMIAQEMASFLKPSAVLLIATCSSSKAMPWTRRLMGRLTRACPDAVVGLLFRLLSHIVMKSGLKRKRLYAAMLREMPPGLVRWQSGVSTEWSLKETLSMPVFQIHGTSDPVIPLKNVKPQRVVQGGGHLINVTHEEEVNRFISESMTKVTASMPPPATVFLKNVPPWKH